MVLSCAQRFKGRETTCFDSSTLVDLGIEVGFYRLTMSLWLVACIEPCLMSRSRLEVQLRDRVLARRSSNRHGGPVAASPSHAEHSLGRKLATSCSLIFPTCIQVLLLSDSIFQKLLLTLSRRIRSLFVCLECAAPVARRLIAHCADTYLNRANMASLRLRRLQGLSPSLSSPTRSFTRSYSALRVSKCTQKPYITSPRNAYPAYSSLPATRWFSSSVTRYDTVVKVPQMAESISEGTLSSFSKQVGDYVERDEEIASIETDKIDVSVNAPEAGTIKELLVGEGDTVTVGQEIAKLEPGEGSSGGAKEATEEPKAPASKDQPTTSDPEPKKEQPKEESKKEAPPPPKKEEKPAPPKEEKKPTSPPSESKQESKGIDSPFGKGSRNENKVGMPCARKMFLIIPGQNEPYASENSRTLEAVSEHCCIANNLQRSGHVEYHGVPQKVQGRDSEEDRSQAWIHERFC
jgi:biotin carboxyl carrier protein